MTRRGCFGGTMGQDQAGHVPLNPPDAPRAKQKGVVAERRVGERGWRWLNGDRWYSLGETNYLAMEQLKLT